MDNEKLKELEKKIMLKQRLYVNQGLKDKDLPEEYRQLKKDYDELKLKVHSNSLFEARPTSETESQTRPAVLK